MAGTKVKLQPAQPTEGKAERFIVTFRLFPPHENTARRYTVCTVLGEQKALVLAVSVHAREHPKEMIYDVVEFTHVEGSSPLGQDIVDRMEW